MANKASEREPRRGAGVVTFVVGEIKEFRCGGLGLWWVLCAAGVWYMDVGDKVS